MSDDSPESGGDDPTYVGKGKEREDEQGDQSTYCPGGSLADGLDSLEIVDLESRYTIIGPIGKGGMGEVFLATDTLLNRKVAIKRILGSAARSKTAVNRFLIEAQSIAAVNHLNIVEIYNFGRAKDGPFLIMEYVAGISLLEKCQEGAIPIEEAIDLACQLCDGLGKAHAANIIHRDIKPANILLTEDGIPKLTDFGLAKAEANDTGATKAGAVLGTFDFMSLEQRRDALAADHRSDLWSLAATIYQMVTGESPRVINLEEVPPVLRTVLGKALKTRPDKRYQSADELGTALVEGMAAAKQPVVIPMAELGAGECPKCHVKNESSRKFCSGCGEAIRASCMKCEQDIPVCDKICGECGAKQAELVKERCAEMTSRQDHAKELLREYNYEAAELVAKELLDQPDSRLQQLKEWAEKFLQDLDREREHQRERTEDLIEDALKYEQASEYEAGIDSLKRVPSSLRDQRISNKTYTINQLLTRLQERLRKKQYLDQLKEQGAEAFSAAVHLFKSQDYQDCLTKLALIDLSVSTDEVISLRQQAEVNRVRLEELRSLIGDAVKLNNLDAPFLLGRVEEYLDLCSKDEEMASLRDRLIDRDHKMARCAEIEEEIQREIEAQEYDGLLTELSRLEEFGPWAADYSKLREWLNSWALLPSELRSAASAFRVAPFLNFRSGDEDSNFLGNRLERSIKAEELWRKSFPSDSDDRSLEVVEQILQLDPEHPKAKPIVGPLRHRAYSKRNWNVRKYTGHQHGVVWLEFVSDGLGILSQDQGGITREWSFVSKREVEPVGTNLYRAAFGNYSFSGLTTDEIEVWDTDSGERIGCLKASCGCFFYIAFSPNEGQFLTICEDAAIRIWELNTLQPLHAFSDPGFQPNTAVFSPQGDLLIVAGSGGIRVWSVESGEVLFSNDGRFDNRFLISSSPDQRHLCWLERNRRVAVADIYKPGPVNYFGNNVRTFCFSPDGKCIATGGVDNLVTTWSTEDFKQIKSFYGHRYAINCVAFSPDGNRIASGSEDETVRLWDVNSGRAIRVFEGHLSSIWQKFSGNCGYLTALAFSSDGTYLASGSTDKTVQVWYAES